MICTNHMNQQTTVTLSLENNDLYPIPPNAIHFSDRIWTENFIFWITVRIIKL